MADQRLVAGIDLGGTKILTLIMDASMKEVGRDHRPSDAVDGGPDVVIAHMADSVRAAAKGRELACVGISSAGPLDLRRGLVTEPPNLHGWHDVPLGALLKNALNIETVLQHDAKAGALAEHRMGAGRGTQHMLYLTLGTGVGGGLVLNGRIYEGTSGLAGEVGHMRVAWDGRRCNCGRNGCLEAMVGGAYLGLDAEDIVRREPEGILARIVTERGEEPSAKVLQEAAEAGDASALDSIHRAGEYLGVGLVNLINIFNPELIVLGGPLTRMGDPYIGTAERLAQREAFPGHLRDVRFAEAELGDEAPAIGAALVAWDYLNGGPDSK